MPRKIRIQIPGAMYHVMSRGDQYEPIFLSDNDRRTFLKTLGEACEKTGWLIHSYVLMSNHYHLLVETPEPNLVEGMRWFQSTYTKRFNSRNKLIGHVFQGRYKSVLIDTATSTHLVFVSNYIHLNPARARLLNRKNPDLNQYRWSSYPMFLKPRSQHPGWLKADKLFQGLDISKDNAAGRKNYRSYMKLAMLEVLDPEKIDDLEEQWNSIRRGWCLGDDTFKEKMLKHVKRFLKDKKESSYNGVLLQEHNQKIAEELVQKALSILKIREQDLSALKKNDPAKQIIAWLVKSHTTVANQWITDRLCMGHFASVTRAVALVNRSESRVLNKLRQNFDKILESKD